MRIIGLVGTTNQPVVAELHKHKDSSYFNLKHGTSGKSLWRYHISLDIKHFKPTEDLTTLELGQDDDYVIKPIYKNDVCVQDGLGNTCYLISKDTDTSHKNDSILLWVPKPRKVKEVKIFYNGYIELLAMGVSGKERGDRTVRVPSPVFEIDGSCSFGWVGIDEKGQYVRQVITYNYSTQGLVPSELEIVDKEFYTNAKGLQ